MPGAKPSHSPIASAAATERSLSLPRRLWSLPGVWFERWIRFRNRLIGDARFQRFAAGFPLTRWMAQRRARQLFDLCAGFVYSQILHACVRLGLFRLLESGPQTVEQVARELDLSVASARRLLDAARALQLVESARDGRYRLSMLGAALRGNPGVARMIEHHSMLYRDLEDPVALLRGRTATELSRFWAYSSAESPSQLEADRVADYSTLMAESQHFIAGDVLDAYSFGRHRRLLDVGGGEGAFLLEAARREPGLALGLFDLPAVAERAKARFAAAGLADRVDCTGGDVFSNPLPAGADAISLVRIIHDHDDAEALAILRAVLAALPTGGTIVVAEPMAATRGAVPIGDAYFGFYLLAMGRGRPRSPAELISMLREVGFSTTKLVPTRRPMLTRVLVATKR